MGAKLPCAFAFQCWPLQTLCLRLFASRPVWRARLKSRPELATGGDSSLNAYDVGHLETLGARRWRQPAGEP